MSADVSHVNYLLRSPKTIDYVGGRGQVELTDRWMIPEFKFTFLRGGFERPVKNRIPR